MIIVSDIDEIPNPDTIQEVSDIFEPGQIYNFCQKWYMYYFNVFCPNEWFGTRICNFDYLTGKSIDLLRHHLEDRSQQPGPVIENDGWHFSFLGGLLLPGAKNQVVAKVFGLGMAKQDQ